MVIKAFMNQGLKSLFINLLMSIPIWQLQSGEKDCSLMENMGTKNMTNE